MDKQSTKNIMQLSQPKHWSGAELHRVSRVLDLLIQIDKRVNKEKNDDKRNTDNTN